MCFLGHKMTLELVSYDLLSIPHEGELEIEVRFGRLLLGKKFTSGVLWNQFERTYNYVVDNEEMCSKVEEKFIRDTFYGEVRVSVETDLEGETVEHQLIKNLLEKKIFTEYGVKVSVSSEEEDTREISGSATLIREKTRTSCLSKTGMTRIDFTKVVQITGETSKPNFEIELELMEMSQEGIDEMNQLVLFLFRLIHDTLIPYMTSEYFTVIKEVNTLLNKKKNILEAFDNYELVQMRNLKTRDIVLNGLLSEGESAKYSATIKADGYRKWLYTNKGAIYLLMAPFDMNKIENDKSLISDPGSLLEGELVVLESGEGSGEEVLFIYDVLFFKGKDLRSLGHDERLKRAFAFIKNYKGPLKLKVKDFIPFSTLEFFYSACNEILDKDFPFKTDGLVFTPIRAPYDPSISYLPLHKRQLTLVNDVCKWKPWDRLTIDFSVIPASYSVDEDKRAYKLYAMEKGELKEFRGTPRFPFYSDRDLDPEGLEELREGAIVEFKPVGGGKLKMLGVRMDKQKPNGMEIAEDIWTDINEPLLEGVIRGESPGLIRNYFSRQFSLIGKEIAGVKSILIFGEMELPEQLSLKTLEKVMVVLEKESDYMPPEGVRTLVVTLSIEKTMEIYTQGLAFFEKPGVDAILVSDMYLYGLFEYYEYLLCFRELVFSLLKRNGKICFYCLDGQKILEKGEIEGKISLRKLGEEMEVVSPDLKWEYQYRMTNLPLFYYIVFGGEDFNMPYEEMIWEEREFAARMTWGIIKRP